MIFSRVGIRRSPTIMTSLSKIKRPKKKVESKGLEKKTLLRLKSSHEMRTKLQETAMKNLFVEP